MIVRLRPELAMLRREAAAARAEIARLVAASPDLGPLVEAGAQLHDLTHAGFDALVAGLAASDPIARALAHLRTSRPVSAADVAARRVPAAASIIPAGASHSTEKPAARPARSRSPARDLPRPAGSRLAALLGDDPRLAAPPDTRALPVPVAEARVARLALRVPMQGRSPIARAGAERSVSSQPAASPTIDRILAGDRPEAALVAADVLLDHRVEPGDPPARPDVVANALSSTLSRLQRSAGSARSAKRASTEPAPAASDERPWNPADVDRARAQPRRSALARLAAAGQSLGPRSQETPDPAPAARLAGAGERDAPSAVERSPVAAPELPAPGDEDELGARLAAILRREARRAGIDLTGWP